MWMILLSFTVEWVQGVADARGWGFKGLFSETPVLGFFTIGLLTNTTLRIWLMFSPNNTVLAGIQQRVGSVIFLCSNGSVSSSSSESNCTRD